MIRISVSLAFLFSLASCSAEPLDLNRATLRCRYPYKTSGSYVGFYSFSKGELTVPPAPDGDLVDLVYYFDEDDCSQGALIGHDDRGGYLFPIGHKQWSELIALDPPLNDGDSPGGIAPLTKHEEGLAMWVKTGGGEFVLVKIRSVHPATVADLAAGDFPVLELEWCRRSLTEGPDRPSSGP